MKVSVVQSEKLEEGKHSGAIIGVEYRDKPFEYVDFIIDIKGLKLKVGYPRIVSLTSGLGKFLQRMGYSLGVGESYELDELIGRTVTFLVQDEVSTIPKYKGKVFSKIQPDSVKAYEQTK